MVIVKIGNTLGMSRGARSTWLMFRLKYTIDDMGLDEFKRQVEERLGRSLLAARKHQPFTKNIDDFSGWVKGDDNLYSHTIFIENGTPSQPLF
jgi:sulfite reductase (NADPH) hemoprotein beta-component